MLAIPKASALPQNLPRITLRTEAPFRPASRSHKPCFLIVANKLRPWRDRAGTNRRVSTIGIFAIATSTALGLTTLPRPLGSTRPRFWLEIIVAANSQRIGKIGIWVGPLVTTIIRKAILPTNALSPASEKTSIGLGNLLVGDWC